MECDINISNTEDEPAKWRQADLQKLSCPLLVVELPLGLLGIARLLSTAVCMSFADKRKGKLSVELSVLV